MNNKFESETMNNQREDLVKRQIHDSKQETVNGTHLYNDIEKINPGLPKKLDAIVEKMTFNGKNYYKTINILHQADIKSEFTENLAEREIIKQRKELILKTLGTILEDIKNYLTQVSILETRKIDSFDSIAQYQAVISKSDGLRRIYHNKLITNIKIVIRLININFNLNFPIDMRMKEEIKMFDRKHLSSEQLVNLMNQREYFQFPFDQGIFLDLKTAPRDSQGEREFIAHWAHKIYQDLTILVKKMSE